MAERSSKPSARRCSSSLELRSPWRAARQYINEALANAGCAPGEEPTLPGLPEGKEDASLWFQVIQRITGTNMLDLEMSGDFRKY